MVRSMVWLEPVDVQSRTEVGKRRCKERYPGNQDHQSVAGSGAGVVVAVAAAAAAVLAVRMSC